MNTKVIKVRMMSHAAIIIADRHSWRVRNSRKTTVQFAAIVTPLTPYEPIIAVLYSSKWLRSLTRSGGRCMQSLNVPFPSYQMLDLRLT